MPHMSHGWLWVPPLTARDLGVVLSPPSLVLAAFALAGYNLAGTAEARDMLEGLSGFAKPLLRLEPPLLVGFIFLNNAVKGLMAILLGPLLGLVPLVFLASNGVILGLVIAESVEKGGVLLTFLGLAPHGILELPAVLLCAGLGLRLGGEALLFLMGRPTHLRQRWRLSLRVYFRLVLPVLLLASVVEVFVTPALVLALR